MVLWTKLRSIFQPTYIWEHRLHRAFHAVLPGSVWRLTCLFTFLSLVKYLTNLNR